MPRAFLIKKKKGFNAVNDIFEQQQKLDEEEETMFPKTKKRKSYEAMTNRLKHEMTTIADKVGYDSGSEGGCCYSTSSRSPSPVADFDSQPPRIPFYQTDSKLNPEQWMKPFLNSYLPIHFPYLYYTHSLSPEAAYHHHQQQQQPFVRSPKCQPQPPSPTYPNSMPPKNGYEEKSSAPSPSPSSSSVTWSDVERCSSAKSSHSDVGEYTQQEVTEVKRSRTSDGSSGGARFRCPDCQKSYSTFSGLTKHQQFHCATTNKRSFSCKYCEKAYTSLGALKMHIRTHTLPCKCELCGKAFSRPWLLQGHMRTHTGEKPFSCTHCNRAFADRSNLRAHLQTHSDVKKYSCKRCSKTFSRMSLLLKHEDGNCCNPQ